MGRPHVNPLCSHVYAFTQAFAEGSSMPGSVLGVAGKTQKELSVVNRPGSCETPLLQCTTLPLAS